MFKNKLFLKNFLQRIQVVGLCSFPEIITGEGIDSLSQASNWTENSDIESNMVEMVTIESGKEN